MKTKTIDTMKHLRHQAAFRQSFILVNYLNKSRPNATRGGRSDRISSPTQGGCVADGQSLSLRISALRSHIINQFKFNQNVFIMINYTVRQRPEPGVLGGGVRKYYPAVEYNGEVTIDHLVKEIEKFSALSEPDIRGVIIALENVIQDELADSKIIRMERLGTFYPSLRANGEELEEDVTASNIERVSVRYRTGKRILDAMVAAGFKRVASETEGSVV